MCQIGKSTVQARYTQVEAVLTVKAKKARRACWRRCVGEQGRHKDALTGAARGRQERKQRRQGGFLGGEKEKGDAPLIWMLLSTLVSVPR